MSTELGNGMDSASINDREYACEAQEAVKLKFGKTAVLRLTRILWHSVSYRFEEL